MNKNYSNIKAIIFDLDGVVSDTQKLHSEVESKLLQKYGIAISPAEITKKYAGVRTRDFFKELLSQQGESYDLEKIIQRKWLQMELLAIESVKEIHGATDLIKKLSAGAFFLAVASASNSNYVEIVLTKLKLRRYFSVVICGNMVRSGKPDPESFLLAATELNVSPQNCLVIEDGVSGMEAAKRAGMECIGLVEDKQGTYPTKKIVSSLVEILEEKFIL